MGAELAGWASFVGALLMIGLELRRSRRAGNDAPALAEGIESKNNDLASRLPFTRGVTAWSAISVLLLVLAGYALNAFAGSLRLRVMQLRDCFGNQCLGTPSDYYEAESLELWLPVVSAAVVAVWCIVAFMLLRVSLHYGLRAWPGVLALAAGARARWTAEPHNDPQPGRERGTEDKPKR